MGDETVKANRIAILDSFRFFAILSVALYHFYPPYLLFKLNPLIYPYGSSYSHFDYGYFGMHFFFIISGFVIASTLTKTKNFTEFFKKRWIRLFPAMFICSLITFIVCNIFDNDIIFPRAHSFKNFIFSLSFFSPMLVENDLFRWMGVNLNYVCGSYWSLWPEIQFYFLAAVIYFLNPQKFYTRFSVIAIGLFIIYCFINSTYLIDTFGISQSNFVFKTLLKLGIVFNIVMYLPWFLTGVSFFQFYSKQITGLTWSVLLFSIISILYTATNLNSLYVILLMLFVFALFVFAPRLLKILEKKFFVTIGASSYSFYLIHSSIGLVLIHNYANSFGPLSFLFPVFLILIFTLFSLLLNKFFEKPLSHYLKKKII